jgi:hypothetical protein
LVCFDNSFEQILNLKIGRVRVDEEFKCFELEPRGTGTKQKFRDNIRDCNIIELAAAAVDAIWPVIAAELLEGVLAIVPHHGRALCVDIRLWLNANQ